MKKILLFFIALLPYMMGFSQVEYTNSPPIDANEMAQRLVGVGVEVFNAELLCGDNGSGYFWNGNSTTLGIESGIVLTTGTIEIAFSSNDRGNASGAGGPGYLPLESEHTNIMVGTFNACVLEFDFIAQSDEIRLNYIFGSEEYPEWAGAQFNDVFAFFIEGLPEYPPETYIWRRNIATVPGSSDPTVDVAINYVNSNIHSEYYQDNTDNPYLQYDGQTTRLSAHASVTPSNTYHLALAVADISDAIYDSGLFIEEGSLSSNILMIESITNNFEENTTTIIENNTVGWVDFSMGFFPLEDREIPISLEPDPAAQSNFQIILGGTATPFEDYQLSHTSVTIPKRSVEDVLLTEKFTQQLQITPIADEAEEEGEYLTLGIYSKAKQDYLSIDTLWIADSLMTHIPLAQNPKFDYRLYPTFTQNGIHLQYQSHQAQSVKIKLFDYSGQFVGTLWQQSPSNVGSFEQYIDLKSWNLSTGVYIVELEVDGVIYQEKIVWY